MLWPTCLVSFALVCICTVCEATSLDTRRHFSTSLNVFRKLVTFSSVTIKDCEEQCFLRKRCMGILYNRRANVCTLTDVPRNDQRLKENEGTVYAVGFHRLQETVSTPICESCKGDQTCLSTEEGHICKISECGSPPSIYTEYWGNMFAVNNTLVVQWEATNHSIICGDDGVWAAVGTQCLPGWASFESTCYFLDETPRNHDNAKLFCEQLLPGSHLADIKTAPEAVFVRNWLNEKGAYLVYIDGEYNATDGIYYFSDGTAFNYDFPFWAQGEPNLDDEHCVAAHGGAGYYTVDLPCSYMYTIACLCKN